jgi:hypothetical protein
MKHIILTFAMILGFMTMNAQETATIKMDEKSMMTMDSMKTCCGPCYCNILSVGGKYYFNTLSNTRTTLAANGFPMDQEAFEYQVRIYNLPKIFYFQQLGTLSNTNYASITGFGVKEDLRWNIVKNSNFIFTPYVELGGGYYRMNISKGVTNSSISTVLGGKVESYYLDNFVLSGDIGLDLGVGFNAGDKRFSIILNGGYITNFPSEWKINSSLAFKEKMNLGSPYTGLTLKMDMSCNKCMDACCK